MSRNEQQATKNPIPLHHYQPLVIANHPVKVAQRRAARCLQRYTLKANKFGFWGLRPHTKNAIQEYANQFPLSS